MSLPPDHRRIAFRVGEEEGAEVGPFFESFLRRKFFDVESCPSPADALVRLQSFDPPIVNGVFSFFLGAYTSDTACDFIAKVRGACSGAKVFVWSPTVRASGNSAIECLKAGAYCYLVPDQHFEIFRGLLEKAIEGRDPFPRIPDVVLRSHSVFIATPYADDANEDVSGIRQGLLAAGVIPRDSRDQPSQGKWLRDQVCRDIGACDAMIVNLTEYGGMNPNVLFEVGYAHGRGIPFIAVRRRGEKRLPADLLGMTVTKYISDVDLAQRLYYGLK